MLLYFSHSLSLRFVPSKPQPAANSIPLCPPILPFALRVKTSKPCRPYCQSSSRISPSREAFAKSAIHEISEKLRSLGYLADDSISLATGPGSSGEIFIPTPHEIPKYRVGHTIDSSWSTPEYPVPEPGSGATMTRFNELWKREGSLSKGKDAKLPTVAELTLPRMELKRLRTLGIALAKRLNVGKAGITEGIVNGIHERWRYAEVVKIAFYDICRMNMKRTHEILERKTGGLVVWRSGNIIILYRGKDYKYPYFHTGEIQNLDEGSSKSVVDDIVDMNEGSSSPQTTKEITFVSSSASRVHSPFVAGVGSPNKLRLQLSGEKQLEEEADRLLDGLGPRFTDWWGYDPLPVDGDLLPPIVPGMRKPFRLLPFGLKPKLTNQELTILRRLSRHIPCHFALGRNRNLQGLSISIIKLWEKCEVAKIAVKRGAQNTNSEMMAEELKKHTGGIILSRNKDFIVLYRGKDFLPHAVSVAIEERRNLSSCSRIQINDEALPSLVTHCSKSAPTGLLESQNQEAAEKKRSLLVVGNAKSASSTIGKVEAKLARTAEKINQSEKQLGQLEKLIEPTGVDSDKEGISEEERYMLRRVGLRMQPFLLLGRRGVFDGTIENMHLHWKYRELVKVLCKGQCFEDTENIARTLEAESGGILVAIERASKGYSIIVYRGKNYLSPANLRPMTLLNKKEALKRYLEAQRHESLKLHALLLSKNIDQSDCQSANNNDTSTLHSSEYEGTVFSSDVTGMCEQIKFDFDLTPESTNNRPAQGASSRENIKAVDATICSNSTSDSSSLKNKSDQDSVVEAVFGPAPLSNKERLLLRKQALQMRKHPVLAVGKGSNLSGVAETMRTHFRKHPLAVVNIKDRAKGTTVQELVFGLEQATGSVLVSREPDNLILYRGWREGEEEPWGKTPERSVRPSTCSAPAGCSDQTRMRTART